MTKKKTISLLLIGALAIAAVFGVFAYRSVRAATPQVTSFSHMGYGRDFGKGMGGYTDQDLATALGITTDQLTAAYQKANSNALDQAVKDGLITQAQADQLKANNSAFPYGNRWEGFLSQNGINYDQFLADALGITLDKLQAAYTQAFNARIDAEVTSGALTQDQADLIKGEHALYANSNFQSAMKSAFEAAVKQAVTDGVITQAQADQILKNESTMGVPGFGRMGGMHEFGGFRGRHGGFGGRGGWGGNLPSNPTTPSTPASPVNPSSFNG